MCYEEKDLKVCEIDQLYLTKLIAPHNFKNATMQTFFNELKEVLEDIEIRGDIKNHVDAYGNFVVSVKVKKEE